MPTTQTHESRRPTRARVINESAMSLLYAMAGTFWIPLDPYKDENPFGPEKPPTPKPKPTIWTTRVGARAIPALGIPRTLFGRRQPTGLEIST